MPPSHQSTWSSAQCLSKLNLFGQEDFLLKPLIKACWIKEMTEEETLRMLWFTVQCELNTG